MQIVRRIPNEAVHLTAIPPRFMAAHIMDSSDARRREYDRFSRAKNIA
jgi:hypothetical protein